MKHRTNRVALGLAALSLVAAACSSGDGTGAPGMTAAQGGGGVSGQILVSGSSTVEPISARVGEEFDAANPGVATAVEGPGTGDGFARFCNGETDISDASRPIQEEEIANCAAAGVEYVDLHIATDGLSVLTSTENEAVSCLDFGDLYALLGPESEGFESWSDADRLAAELLSAGLGGTNAPYPDVPLVITAPGEESGTFDNFIEQALEDIAEERGQEATSRPDYEASANDNVIIQGISGNPTSLGWVGFAFFLANQETVTALDIDGGEGCVTPTEETIASFEYPLSRPLFIYVKTNDLAERPALTAFVDYYLSDEGLANVSEAGYVQLPAAAVDETRAAWEAVRG
ncbi:MAG: substrate-binding domain-containing protein [Acidimicrobiia bacterium]